MSIFNNKSKQIELQNQLISNMRTQITTYEHWVVNFKEQIKCYERLLDVSQRLNEPKR